MVKKIEPTIHIKFDYDEAKSSKKEMLYSQISFLKIYKRIIEYKKLREQEFLNKQKINILIKEINQEIIQIDKFFPKIIMPKILKKKEDDEEEDEENDQRIREYDTVEEQLKDIQKKLRSLE